MEEICGLEVVPIDDGEEIAEEAVKEMHARLAFACLPEHTLCIYTYRPGAVRQQVREMLDQEWIADTVQGANETEGSQTVYLQGYVGEEATLITVTLLALEVLGGEVAAGIDAENRGKCDRTISVDELRQRHRQMAKLRHRLALGFLLSLPLLVPVFLLGCLGKMITMPYRLWKAYRQVDAMENGMDEGEKGSRES